MYFGRKYHVHIVVSDQDGYVDPRGMHVGWAWLRCIEHWINNRARWQINHTSPIMREAPVQCHCPQVNNSAGLTFTSNVHIG